MRWLPAGGICRFSRCIDPFLFDPAVDAVADAAVHRIGLIEIDGQVISDSSLMQTEPSHEVY